MRLGQQERRPEHTPGGRRGAWWTPPRLAYRVASWIGPARRGLHVVDAGAGEGSLTTALVGTGRARRITAVEIDAGSAGRLEQHREPAARLGVDLSIVHGDWLQWRPAPKERVDVVITNPVWEDDIPHRFMIHGAQFARRVIGIVPASVLSGVQTAEGHDATPTSPELEPLLWHVRIARIAICVRRPNFDPGGDGGQRDCVVLDCVPRTRATSYLKGQPEPVSIEWWHDRW